MNKKILWLIIFFALTLTTNAQVVFPEDLDTIPFVLKNQKQYGALKEYLEQKKQLLETEGKTESYTYAFTLLDYCSVRAALNDFNIYEDLEIALDHFENKSLDWDSYWVSIYSYEREFDDNDCEQCVKLIKERQVKYCKTKFGPYSREYSNSLVQYLMFIMKTDDVESCLNCCLEGLRASESLEPSETDDFSLFATVLNRIYENQRIQGNESAIYKEIELGERLLNRTNHLKNIDIVEQINQYEHLLHLYFEAGEYEKSESYGKKALEIAEDYLGKENILYAEIEKWYLISKEKIVGSDNVKKSKLENLQRRERILNSEDENVIKIKREIASDYSSIYCYEDAIRVIESILNHPIHPLNPEDENYINIIMDLASYKRDNENFSDCMSLYNEVIDKRKASNDVMYVFPKYMLGSLYTKLGEYLKSIDIFESIYKEIEGMPLEILDGKKLEIIQTIKNSCIKSLATNYGFLGIKDKAASYSLQYYNLVDMDVPDIVIRELEAERSGKDYIYTDEDIEFVNEINQEAYEDLLGFGLLNTPDHASYLFDLSMPYLLKKDYVSAGKMMEEGLTIYENLKFTDNLDYAGKLELYALNCIELGNIDKALELLRKSLAIKKSKLPEVHPDILDVKRRITLCEFQNNDIDVINSAIEVSNGLRSLLIPVFSQLTSLERNMYWDKYKDWFLNEINEINSKYNNEKLIEAALDGILLGKGLLINTDIEFSSLIKDSNNPTLIDKFYKMNSMRSLLNKSNDLTTNEFLELEAEIQAIEKELISESKQYGEYTQNLDIRWNQVQKNLGKQSLAIEFVSYTNKEISKKEYSAFLIKPGNSNPQFVILFNDDDLGKLSPSRFYTEPRLSQLIWGKLSPYVEDATDIYFSPSGDLYNIAIEYLPHYNKDGLMSDYHNFHRLSSTRQLSVLNTSNYYNEAVLYGGLIYDTEMEFLMEDMKKYPNIQDRGFLMDRTADLSSIKIAVSDLPETNTEVDNIERSFIKTKITPILYKGAEGTEASFKSLSGSNINIMHIATHGFYWTESEAEKAKNASFLKQGNDATLKYVEDKAMTRSGLLFSGANNALKGVPLAENVEDGILTAKEISQLDLRSLDLVVLSACQTALGEITGDGVFGLQRGFKKAGASSLLMSLWKVDDKATQMLMTKFYEEYLGGKSKYESLKNAQKFLREYEEDLEIDLNADLTPSQRRQKERQGEKVEPQVTKKTIKPYEDSKYWAAFILLDAIN